LPSLPHAYSVPSLATSSHYTLMLPILPCTLSYLQHVAFTPRSRSGSGAGVVLRFLWQHGMDGGGSVATFFALVCAYVYVANAANLVTCGGIVCHGAGSASLASHHCMDCGCCVPHLHGLLVTPYLLITRCVFSGCDWRRDDERKAEQTAGNDFGTAW